MNLKEIEKLIQLVQSTDIAEFELSRGGETLKIKRGGVPGGALKAGESLPAQSESTSGPNIPEAEPASNNLIEVRSPLVGTFYRSPNPDAKPFVEIGETVSKGQVLCIVEAMKLMNEIEAEGAGKIVAVLVDNGRPVEYGEPLFRIEPLE